MSPYFIQGSIDVNPVYDVNGDKIRTRLSKLLDLGVDNRLRGHQMHMEWKLGHTPHGAHEVGEQKESGSDVSITRIQVIHVREVLRSLDGSLQIQEIG